MGQGKIGAATVMGGDLTFSAGLIKTTHNQWRIYVLQSGSGHDKSTGGI